MLAQAGLLDGVRCTTHHAFADEFRRLFPAASLDEDTIFTLDPDRGIWTSAGGASGLDLCLSLVMYFSGPAVASEVDEAMSLWNPQPLCLVRREWRGDTASEPCDACAREASQGTALRVFLPSPSALVDKLCILHAALAGGIQHA